MSLHRSIKNLFKLAVVITAVLIFALLLDNLLGFMQGEAIPPRVDVKSVLQRIEEAQLKPREALYYEIIHEETHGSGKTQ